jgi:hypothetical protein
MDPALLQSTRESRSISAMHDHQIWRGFERTAPDPVSRSVFTVSVPLRRKHQFFLRKRDYTNGGLCSEKSPWHR